MRYYCRLSSVHLSPHSAGVHIEGLPQTMWRISQTESTCHQVNVNVLNQMKLSEPEIRIMYWQG